MSAIAQVLLEMGHGVSGSDLEESYVTKRLERSGARISIGHGKSNLPSSTDVVVYSSSIDRSNPEMEEAARRRIRVMHRAQMLGEIFNREKGVAITGTHGKTTTTSMIAVMLKNSGLDPTALIGGDVRSFGGNSRLGRGGIVVAEADESDSSFHHLRPLYAVITNIEMEHLDHFKDMAGIHRSYRKFIGNLKRGGKIFYNADDLNARKVMSGFKGRSASFGFSEKADMRPSDIRMKGFSTSFTCEYKGRALGKVELSIPGEHNVLNAMAAILIGMDLGLPFRSIKRSIKDFDGAKRRFELRASSAGVMLIEDYAHHPTEISAVLKACRNWPGRRVVAVFQPHRYTRTKFLADDFGKCFSGVDKLILTDIFAASEKAVDGVSARLIYNRAVRNGVRDVSIMDKCEIADHIMKVKRKGDIILVLGAGDIKKVANELSERMGPAQAGTVNDDLVRRLKRSVKGEVKTGEDLSRRTSFRIGGPADIWVEPKDPQDLKRVIRFARSCGIQFFVIGNGSNLLVSDDGFRGMLIHLGSEHFRKIEMRGAKVRVGAGFSLPRLVRRCCEKGLAGLESMVGIPGTVGGAIYMNAGGYTNPIYRNIGSAVESLKIMDREGKIRKVRGSELVFGYRTSNLGGSIILEAVLKLQPGDSKALIDSSLRFMKMKKEKHVLELPNAGCVFKNPGDFHFTCGQMIDTLKLKGKRVGGAEISPKHANFIVNKNGASCKDVVELIGFVRRKVKDSYGIDLELEVKVI